MNRVVLITGVGPGLGAALARRFAREGFRVGLVARKADFIEALAGEISAAGSPALSLVADVSRPAEAAAAVDRVRADLGPVGVLIHNASSSLGEGLLATTPQEFEQSWRVAALGGFVCARETAPDMLAAGAGAMLFTGATSSVRGGGCAGVQQREVCRARSRAIPRPRVVAARRACGACRHRRTDRSAPHRQRLPGR